MHRKTLTWAMAPYSQTVLCSKILVTMFVKSGMDHLFICLWGNCHNFLQCRLFCYSDSSEGKSFWLSKAVGDFGRKFITSQLPLSPLRRASGALPVNFYKSTFTISSEFRFYFTFMPVLIWRAAADTRVLFTQKKRKKDKNFPKW